jgi:hypothetical protein
LEHNALYRLKSERVISDPERLRFCGAEYDLEARNGSWTEVKYEQQTKKD